MDFNIKIATKKNKLSNITIHGIYLSTFKANNSLLETLYSKSKAYFHRFFTFISQRFIINFNI